MKKKILVAFVILAMATGCGKIPKLNNGEDAVVSFKDEKLNISVNELYEQLKDKYALNDLIDLIDGVILAKEYPNNNDEAETYVKEQLDSVKASYKDESGNYDEASLLEALNNYYRISTIEGFEKLLSLSFYRGKAIEDYAKAQIDDKQIEEYYKKETVGDIECKHILIASDATDEMTEEEKAAEEEKALKTAKNVIKELDGGADFAALAKKYSDDSSNAETGGDLGYFNKGKMVSEFETAAYALKLNAYTKTPVKTSFGYHIILKTGEKEKAALKDVKEEIVTTLGKKLESNDQTLSVNALADLRKEYGFEIQDSNLKTKYSTFISNQLLLIQQEQNTTTTKKAK